MNRDLGALFEVADPPELPHESPDADNEFEQYCAWAENLSPAVPEVWPGAVHVAGMTRTEMMLARLRRRSRAHPPLPSPQTRGEAWAAVELLQIASEL